MRKRFPQFYPLCLLLFGAYSKTLLACGVGASSSTIIPLPTLGGSAIQINAINPAGQIVGFSYLSGDMFEHGFLFSSGNVADLGTLGGDFSQAVAINSTAQVVGDSYTADNSEIHAFLFQNGVLNDLGTLGGPFSGATGINETGMVIGNSLLEDWTSQGFWYTNGVMTGLGDLGGGYSFAAAINQQGVIVGDSLNTNFEDHAFVFVDGQMTDIGTLGGDYSAAMALNDAGIVVGESLLADRTTHAFSYSAGVMTDLGTLGGTYSTPVAINSAGQVIGISTITNDTQTHAFLYGAGVMTDLGTLGGTFSSAAAINNAGQVVGFSGLPNGNTHAFLWQNGLLSDLNSFLPANSGWELFSAQVINDAGRIAGMGSFQGVYQAYALDLASLNHAPAARAGSDQVLECPQTVTLDGSASNDPDGDALAYQWSEGALVLGTNVTFSAFFALGTHTVTLRATDPCGASSETQVTIQVQDSVAPTILSSPAPIQLAVGDNCQAMLPNLLGGVVASDNCTRTDNLGLSQSPAAGTFLALGQHAVSVTVSDTAGNAVSVPVAVMVVDTTAPVFQTAPASIQVAADGQCQASVPNLAPGVVVVDNCTPAAQLVYNQSPAAGSVLGLGSYPVTLTVTDLAGNTASATAILTISDSTPPSIQSVSATPSVLSPPNHQIVPVTVTVAAQDACDPSPRSKIVSVTCNESSPSTDVQITGDLTVNLAATRNPSGAGRIYTITVACFDYSGNASTGTVTVTVPKGSK